MKILKAKNNAVVFLKKQYGFFSKIFNKEKTSSIKKKSIIISICMIAAFLLPVFPFSTLTFAYEVKYNNLSLGFVSEESVIKQAETLVNEQMPEKISKSTEYNFTLIPTNALNNATEISERVINNTNVIKAYGIFADGVCLVASKSKTLLLNVLEYYQSDVFSKSKGDIALFDKNIEVKECLSFGGKLAGFDEILSIIKSKIKVNIGVYSTKTTETDYKVIEKKDSSIYKGVTKVITKGQKGIAKTSLVTFYQDTKKVYSKILDEKTTSKVKDEVVLIGTKELPNVKIKKGAKYVWPIIEGASCHISSGFGTRSGKLHKGIDIIAAKGTEIIAAMDGKVTRASWFESYGYCIDILHNDGTLTRYAHCSELIAEKGDTVVAGQIIAKVGSTGRSTANHLHFEVRPNGGNPVNPCKYVKK